jgi:hypothetical protein
MKEENEQEVANNDTQTKSTEQPKENPTAETADGKVIEATADGYQVDESSNVETNTESPNLDNEIIEDDGTKDWIYTPYEFISGGKHKGLSVATYGFQTDKGTTLMTIVERDGVISNDIEFIPEARIIKHEDGTRSIK